MIFLGEGVIPHTGFLTPAFLTVPAQGLWPLLAWAPLKASMCVGTQYKDQWETEPAASKVLAQGSENQDSGKPGKRRQSRERH